MIYMMKFASNALPYVIPAAHAQHARTAGNRKTCNGRMPASAGMTIMEG